MRWSTTASTSATRAIRKAVRVAVHARDGTCIVRGCHRNRRTQTDHRHDYAHGGQGSTDNLELLCEFHHNQKTRHGARLERHDNQWHWYPPTPPGTKSSDPWISPVGANLTLWDLDTC